MNQRNMQAANIGFGSLGAMHIGGRIMIIDTIAALKLIGKYFCKMKNKSKELDVDFIGGQNKPLTKEE